MPNSQTERKLSEINPEDFENLARQFLRIEYPEDCKELISLGMNEDGKPVVSQVDNLCFVPSNPPRLVVVASTTIALNALRGKWFGKKNDKGDIPKAGESFDDWRKNHPNLVCVLYLVTNRLLRSSETLYQEAVKKAKIIGADRVHIIEQSQFADFLDSEKGQRLRFTYLLIPIHILNEDVLKAVAETSLREHNNRFTLNTNTSPIKREVQSQLEAQIKLGKHRLIALVGVSGVGKSTLLRQTGEELNKGEHYAIWIPAERLRFEQSFLETIQSVLHIYYPSIQIHSLHHLLSITRKKLLLLIDDISRVENPQRLFDLIKRWNRDLMTSGELFPAENVCCVVAVQTGLIREIDKDAEVDSLLELKRYSTSEIEKLASSNTEIHNLRYRQMAEAFQSDPFLCGLIPIASDIYTVAPLAELFRTTVSNFLSGSAEIVRTELQTFDPAISRIRLLNALEQLTQAVLNVNHPDITFDECRNETNSAFEYIKLWSRRRNVGWFEEKLESEQWNWKHYRLRDLIVGSFLSKRTLNNPAFDDVSLQSYLANPGLAEAWAIALILLKNEKTQLLLVDQLSKSNLVALAEILRLNLLQENSKTKIYIIEVLVSYLTQEIQGNADSDLKAIKIDVLEKIAQIRDSSLLTITKIVKINNFNIMLARLGNGDTIAGIYYLSGLSIFHPMVSNPTFDSALNDYQNLTAQDKSRVNLEYDNALSKSNLPLLSGAMTFAGYLTWSEIIPNLLKRWNILSNEDKIPLIKEYIWMVTRCGHKDVKEQLQEALTIIRETIFDKSTEETRKLLNNYFTFDLEVAFRIRKWDIPDNSALAWSEAIVSESSDELKIALVYVARVIDHPLTVQHYIYWVAKNGDSFPIDWTSITNPMAKRHRGSDIGTDPRTRRFLWSIIEANADIEVRKTAFYFWRVNMGDSDLRLAQSIDQSDPLFDKVLQERARLHDESALPYILSRLPKDLFEWFIYLTPFLDREDAYQALLDNLESALDHIAIPSASVLRYIPNNRLINLLHEKKETLQNSCAAIYHLWRSDNSIAHDFVREALNQISAEKLAPFFIYGESPLPVSRDMLEVITPFLTKFPAGSLQWTILSSACRSGYSDWVRQHLLARFYDERSYFDWLEPKDIFLALDDLSKLVQLQNKAPWSNMDFLRRYDDHFSREKYGADILNTVYEWLKINHDDHHIILASSIIASHGTEESLNWWINYEPLKSNEKTYSAWANCTYTLRRKKWQN